MGNLELIAIEKFAKNLKVNLPILLKPRDFSDRIINMHNEHTHKLIDLAIEKAKLEWEIEVKREARHYGKK